MKVGAAQIESVIGDPDANMGKHLEFVARGSAAALDLLVFPEVSLLGHHGAHHMLDAAMKRDDPRLLRLAEAAGDMHTVVGFVEEGPAAQFYNAAAILHRGKVVFLHRKINLPTYGKLEEGKFYAAGQYVDTHALTPEWRAGLLICADLWSPALTHLSFLHGATLMIAPISSAVEAVGEDFDSPGNWALALRFYAMMYGAPVIMANRCGVEKDLTFWGGSRIIDPHGHELAVAGSGEELLAARIDYAEVRRARVQLPTLRDSNPALVQRETTRLSRDIGVPGLLRA